MNLLFSFSRHKNDKLFLTDFISTLRRSLTTAILQNGDDNMNIKNPRLPAVDALYLAKALMVSTAPFDPLYKPVNNFFIAKQFVDLTVVPDFLSLFHDSDVESADRRSWILETIRDGTKTMTDVNVVFKTMCLKMIMDYSSSALSDRKERDKILSVLNSIIAIPRAFEILLEGYGLISWLHSLVKQMGKDDRLLVKRVVCVIENMLRSMTLNAFARNVSAAAKNGKSIEAIELKVNKDVEHEILIILYDLLSHVNHLEIDDVAAYIKIYSLLTKKTIKLLSKSQILTLVNKSSFTFKDSEIIKLLTNALVKDNVAMLKSRNLSEDNGLLNDLTAVVKTYLL